MYVICLHLKTAFQSKVDHPRTLLAPVTLTLTRWPWLRTWPEDSEDVPAY